MSSFSRLSQPEEHNIAKNVGTAEVADPLSDEDLLQACAQVEGCSVRGSVGPYDAVISTAEKIVATVFGEKTFSWNAQTAFVGWKPTRAPSSIGSGSPAVRPKHSELMSPGKAWARGHYRQ